MTDQTNHHRFIDVAKGLGILFIVLGHVVPNAWMNQILYSFHVPLFFILSGFTYQCKSDKKRFYVSKGKRLLIPYFVFAVISIVIFFVMAKIVHISEDARILPNLAGMLYGNSNTGYMMWNRPLWFLPCLFCSFVFLDSFETVIRNLPSGKKNLFRLGFILGMWALGLILNCCLVEWNLPFHLESAVFLVGFSEVGVLLSWIVKQCAITETIHKENRIPALLGAVALLVIGLGLCWANGSVDIRSHHFGKIPVLLPCIAVCFCGATIWLSMILEKSRVLALLGASSLAIMLMHKFPILFFQMIVPFTRDCLKAADTAKGTACGIAVAMISAMLCLVAEKIIVLIFPACVGKTQVRKNAKGT